MDFLKNLDMNTILLIVGVVYLILPADSPIKAFLNKILSILSPNPTPGPTPGPLPGPVVPNGPIDVSTLLQLLMSILLKAKASGDAKLQESVLSTIEAVQAEQAAARSSAVSAHMFR